MANHMAVFDFFFPGDQGEMISHDLAPPAGPAAPRRLLPVLLVLFVGSGCAALIYEVVWLQLLAARDRLDGCFPGGAAGDVHGRHVHGQPAAAASGF